jgi:hypothetical protein
MRKKTLAGVCLLLAIVILVALRFAGVKVPFGFSPLFAYLVLFPLLMVPLAFLNKYLLAWRKTRGRDIEDEEQYEVGTIDIISLRPRSERPFEGSEEDTHLPAVFRKT